MEQIDNSPLNPLKKKTDITSSREVKQVEKRATKVISGNAKIKKQSKADKIKNNIISEDIGNVKDYILMDVLLPSLKRAVVDIVSDGISMLIYGEKGRGKKSRDGSSKIAYSSYYDRDDRFIRGSGRQVTRARGFEYDTVIFDSRAEANEALRGLDNIIDTYHSASIADLYDLAGLSITNYTYNNYGWLSLQDAKISPTRDGWVIQLPKPVPVD